MKEYEIKTTQLVTQEDIDDVLVTAFEGGITYWCDEVRVKEGHEASEDCYKSEVLTRGGVLELHDEEGWHTLTLDKLLEVLGNMHFNFDDYDAGDADTAVQKAVFGELVYG